MREAVKRAFDVPPEDQSVPWCELAVVTEEQWRPVPGYPFDVSTEGRVREQATRRIRNSKPNTLGYVMVSNGRGHKPYLHALVALAFLGPRPSGMQVRHLDDDKSNNRPSNLAYGSCSDNRNDSVRNGTHPMANKTHCKHGHPLEGDNLGMHAHGRFCKTCSRERHRVNAQQRRRRPHSQEESA